MATLPELIEQYINDTVGLSNVTNDTQLKRSDNDWGGFTEEPNPGSTDVLLVEKVTTGAKRKVLIGNLPTGGGGEANTASNQGAGGVGLFLAKVGIDLQFKNINAGSNKITVTDDPVNKEVDIDLVPGNIAHQTLSGAGVQTHAQIDAHLASTGNPHAVTAAQVGLGNVSNEAQLTRAAGDLNSFPEKTTPASADVLLLEDSAAGYAKKKVRLANLPTGSGGSTTFTGLTDAPDSYVGQGAKVLRVNAAENALEFGYPDYLVTGTAGENLAAYDFCYLKSDGKYWKAHGGSEATMPGLVLAGSVINANQSGTFIRRGRVSNGAWLWSKIGGYVYASTTSGALTQTLLSESGQQVQIVGIALSATQIDFDPQLTLVEVP